MELFHVSPLVGLIGGTITGLVALFIYNRFTGEWVYMTRKKCKECKGRGFVFITVPDVKFKSIYDYSIRDTGEKAQCMKCFGKGVK